MIAAAWLTGAIVFLLPMAAGLWQLRRILRFGLPWLPGEAILRDLGIKMGIKKPVDMLLHSAIPGPMTCGTLRPAVVFPSGVQNWSMADLQRDGS